MAPRFRLYSFQHKPYISVWLALTDTNEKNGALSIIPTNLKTTKNAKSHKWQNKSKDLGIKVNEKKAIQLCVSAGTLIIFSSLTPHSSSANVTKKIAKHIYLNTLLKISLILSMAFKEEEHI